MEYNLREINRDKILNNIQERHSREQFLSNASTRDTLETLKIPLDSIPQKCLRLLQDLGRYQTQMSLESLEPITVSHVYCQNFLNEMENNYYILKLRQKNSELKSKIERNEREIALLKKGLEQARMSLTKQTTNPATIEEDIRAMKQKVTSYKENYEKTKVKFENLNVPEELYPKSLEDLVGQLTALRAQELELKERADDVTLREQIRSKWRF